MQTIKKKGFSPSKKSEPQLMIMANKALDLVSLHQKNLTRAAAVLAAVVVIAAGYTLFQSNNDKKASAMLAAAQGIYQEQAAGAAPDYSKALEAYRDVLRKYPRTMSGAIAQFYIGNCLVQLNQPNEALREYETLSKNKFVDKGLAGLAYQRMGYVYSALGKQSEAITSFEQAEAVLGPGLATVELAKMYERAGNGVEAQKKNKVIAEKLGGTTFAPAVQGAAAPPAPGSAGK